MNYIRSGPGSKWHIPIIEGRRRALCARTIPGTEATPSHIFTNDTGLCYACTAKQRAQDVPAPRQSKPQQLPLGTKAAMTRAEVAALLGGVSHVTILNLTRAGHLIRLDGTAQQSGGGHLYDGATARKFAKTYTPQAAHRKHVRGQR